MKPLLAFLTAAMVVALEPGYCFAQELVVLKAIFRYKIDFPIHTIIVRDDKLCTGEGNDLVVRQASNGAEVMRSAGHAESVTKVCSVTSDSLATGGMDKKVLIHRLRAKERDVVLTLEKPVTSLSYCAARGTLICGDSGGTITEIDLKTRKVVNEYSIEGAITLAEVVAPNQTLIVTNLHLQNSIVGYVAVVDERKKATIVEKRFDSLIKSVHLHSGNKLLIGNEQGEVTILAIPSLKEEWKKKSIPDIQELIKE